MKIYYLLILLSIFGQSCWAQNAKQYSVHTVGFYNLENLFDTIRDEKIYDEEWTPKGSRNWDTKKYNQKLANLSRVISEIGVSKDNSKMPTILGVSEIENRRVLEDLVAQPALLKGNYGVIHFDSPDKRGIDVGLLYQKKYFTPLNYVSIPLYIYDNSEPETKDFNGGKGKRIYTRDQLVVSGIFDGEEINFIVSHWPSRSGGEKKSNPNREAAAALNKKIIDSLYQVNPNAKVITMGDFNDGPYNNSVDGVLEGKAKKEQVKEKGLFNPMWQMYKDGLGTIAYRDAWDIFDQMIVSEPLIRKDFSSYRFWKAGIYSKQFMIQQSGQYKGYPLRNQNSGEPGYSDHFPVYMYLLKEKN